jgi:hypothetical protein
MSVVKSRPADVSYRKRHFEQAPGVDRPPPVISYASSSFKPATQGQRAKDQISQTTHIGLQTCFG